MKNLLPLFALSLAACMTNPLEQAQAPTFRTECLEKRAADDTAHWADPQPPRFKQPDPATCNR